MEGNLHSKINWASFIVGREFTVFALFYFVIEGNFQVQAPGGAYILRGTLTEGFLCYEFAVLIFGGAYFRNFTVIKIPTLFLSAFFVAYKPTFSFISKLFFLERQLICIHLDWKQWHFCVRSLGSWGVLRGNQFP